jgi:hypothetical protein
LFLPFCTIDIQPDGFLLLIGLPINAGQLDSVENLPRT